MFGNRGRKIQADFKMLWYPTLSTFTPANLPLFLACPTKPKNTHVTLLGEIFTSIFSDGSIYMISLQVCNLLIYFIEVYNIFNLTHTIIQAWWRGFSIKLFLFPIITEATIDNFSCYIIDFNRSQPKGCHMNFYTSS